MVLCYILKEIEFPKGDGSMEMCLEQFTLEKLLMRNELSNANPRFQDVGLKLISHQAANSSKAMKQLSSSVY